jgi:hypothetical protein
MFFFFVSLLFAIIINKIEGQNIDSDLRLILVNGTGRCEIENSTTGEIPWGMCLNGKNNYECNNNLDNIGLTLDCNLISNNTDCDEDTSMNLICNFTILNFTLSETGNVNPFQLLNDSECLYGIYYNENRTNTNDTFLLCTSVIPTVIVVNTTGVEINVTLIEINITEIEVNMTDVIPPSKKHYSFHIFGWKVTKNFVKKYGIPIIIGIIVVGCLIGCCCFRACYSCCKSNDKKKHHQRMPQSSNVCNV